MNKKRYLRKSCSTVLFFFMMLCVLFEPGIFADQFGIKAGIDFSRLANVKLLDLEFNEQDISQYQTTKPGLVFGAFFRLDVYRFLSIQPEIYFAMKGAKYDFPDSGSLEFDLDFIEIPVLLKLRLPILNRKFYPSIFLGPYIAFNRSAALHIGSLKTGSPAELDVGKKNDFGWLLGAGIDIRCGSGNVLVETRLELGQTGMFRDGSDIKNSTLSILLGYAFNKKK